MDEVDTKRIESLRDFQLNWVGYAWVVWHKELLCLPYRFKHEANRGASGTNELLAIVFLCTQIVYKEGLIGGFFWGKPCV